MAALADESTVVVNALHRLAARRWTVGLGLALIGLPVLRWYAARMLDGSDEPLGVLALLAAVLLAPHQTWREQVSPGRLKVVVALAALCLFVLNRGPILLCALIWVLAVAALVAPRGRSFAWGSLCVLSLPWLATVQFFLGFPLRVAITWVAALALNVCGFAVAADATLLTSAGERVLIDAPCSGIQMAWTLAFLAAVLANVRKLGTHATLRLMRWASLFVFVANTVRAMGLFVLEIRFHVSAGWVHNLVGLACFAGSGLALLAIARPRQGLTPATMKTGQNGVTPPGPDHASSKKSRGCRSILYASLAGVIVCIAVLVLSDGKASVSRLLGSTNGPKESFPGWESSPLPLDCSAVELSARDKRFAEGFPGKIGAFSDGERQYIARWVARPTRKLHSASDCLRGAGFTITPGPAERDGLGQLWSTFNARRGLEKLHVAERIKGPEGKSWTDVSAWYWSALLQKSAGPWWAMTVISKQS